MNILQPGEMAPDFAMIDVNGRTVRLADYKGSKVLLTFYRFAACPFCTVHFARMSKEAKRLEQRGLKMISVFESEPGYIREYLSPREAPFPIIADPDAFLYKKYAVQKSMKGVLKGMFKRLPSLIKVMLGPVYRFGKPDGNLLRIPADFIIDIDGKLLDAYYGKDASDNIPMSQIEKRLLSSNKVATANIELPKQNQQQRFVNESVG